MAASGRGDPWGGIIPPRSFRTAFSQTSACSGTSDRLIFSNDTPDALTRSLWHVTRYLTMTADWRSGALAGADAGCAAARGTPTAARHTATNTAVRT